MYGLAIIIFRPFFKSGIRLFATLMGKANFKVSPIKTPLILSAPIARVFIPITSPD